MESRRSAAGGLTLDEIGTPDLGLAAAGYAIGFLPGASAFYTQQLSSRVSFGLGVFSNFGLALEYDSDWVGRYDVQKAALLGMSVMPALAFKVSDTLSLGVSLNAMYGLLDDMVAINNVSPQFSKRGPLAGRVAGHYSGTSMSFANINATWKS